MIFPFSHRVPTPQQQFISGSEALADLLLHDEQVDALSRHRVKQNLEKIRENASRQKSNRAV